MKITMKSMISVATGAVLTLAVGMAYADDAFNPYVSPGTSIGQGSAAGGVGAEAAIRYDDHSIDQVLFAGTKDTGAELYKDYLKNEADVAKGSAAGGARDLSGDHAKVKLPRFPDVITE
jgi:hypothetical protein